MCSGIPAELLISMLASGLDKFDPFDPDDLGRNTKDKSSDTFSVLLPPFPEDCQYRSPFSSENLTEPSSPIFQVMSPSYPFTFPLINAHLLKS